jgi:alpha,alpha-trehalase
LEQVYDITDLFEAVQLSGIFSDNKTFPDCIAKTDLESIATNYYALKNSSHFGLKEFVLSNFELPNTIIAPYVSNSEMPIADHIKKLWPHLTRNGNASNGSLIALPNNYVVPGGRFREVYYWDSYFTMLGLAAQNEHVLIQNMVDNFAYLIKQYGHIPNGNRTYYLSRSQPPFFALMVELLANTLNDEHVYTIYLDVLETEYAYWQLGNNSKEQAQLHKVQLDADTQLNRYFDHNPTPRQESYKEDVHTANNANQRKETIYSNIRAGAESGWDFSSRWFADASTIETITTIDIIPVDLNCLLYKLEKVIAKANTIANNIAKANAFEAAATLRLNTVFKYCWNKELQFFTDYNWVTKKQISKITAAGVAPLFVTSGNAFIAQHIHVIVKNIENNLLKPGGIVTTTYHTGQQWDAPNGWAPLQWLAVMALANYKQNGLAIIIAKRWVLLNEKTFATTGKMMEKYNVEDLNKTAGGGEYQNQDGFGWTNGVYLALKNFINNNE